MSEPYLGQISIFAFEFAPSDWALANGQLLSIEQNTALFSLLGTFYGGNGTTNFQLPNLQGMAPMHVSDSGIVGETGGEQNHTLTVNEIPSHTHTPLSANVMANTGNPGGSAPAVAIPQVGNVYAASGGATMSAQAIEPSGNSQPHPNMQPYLALNFCIALQGIFPSRN